MKIKKLVLMSMLILGTMSAEAAKPGAYLGVGLGYGELENFADATTTDTSNVAGKLFLGYNFTKYFGIETAYTQFADTDYELYNNPLYTLDYKYRKVDLVGKLYLPLSSKYNFNLYGLGGASYVMADYEYEYRSGRYYSAGDDSRNEVLFTAGAGMSMDLNRNVVASIEYVHTDGANSNDTEYAIPYSDMLTFNLGFRFT